MRLLINLLILAVFIAIQFYFFKKSRNILNTLFPNRRNQNKILIRSIVIIYSIFPFFWISQLLLRFSGVLDGFYTPKNILFDYGMIYPFWLLFIVVIQMIPFFALSELIRVPFLKLLKSPKETYIIGQAKVLLSILVLFLVYIPVRILYDDTKIDTFTFDHTISNLHPDLEDLNIIVISDVQADYYTGRNRLQSYVDKVNELKPDLIFIAGDMITNTPDYIDLAGEMISKLSAKYGVYAGPGDHDHWAFKERSDASSQKSLSEVIKSLESRKVPVFVNENHTINVKSAKIKLTSTDQNYAYRQINRNLLDSLARSGNQTSDLKLFLNHQPNLDLVEKAKEYNYDIFLTGHTHGGQIVFWYPPFFNISGTTLTEPTYIQGKYMSENLLVAVSAGLGVSIAPIRYNATPEIISIRLKSKMNSSLAMKNK